MINNDYGTLFLTINGVSKAYTGTETEVWAAADGTFNLDTAYPMTLNTAAGGSISGYPLSFLNVSNTTLSGSTWDGNNSSPLTITFTAAVSSAKFSIES